MKIPGNNIHNEKMWTIRGLLLGIMILGLSAGISGQGKFLTSQGYVSFYSHTAIEDITAANEEVGCVIDSESGAVAIIVEMKRFQFEKKLMQEHFNENYVESEKFPKATFNGTILNNGEVDYSKPGKHQVKVEGDMTIHGVKKAVSAEGTLEILDKGVIATTKFLLNPEDYDIKIPRVVRNNIAERMEITAKLACDPI
jgi:polyisoprenoid-binding protein YceI